MSPIQESEQHSWVSPPPQLPYAMDSKENGISVDQTITTKDIPGPLAVDRIYVQRARILSGTPNDPFRFHKPSFMWQLEKTRTCTGEKNERVKEAEKGVGKLWNRKRKCRYELRLPYLLIVFSSINNHIDTVLQRINHFPADGIKTQPRIRLNGIGPGSVLRHRDDVLSYIFTRPLESIRTAKSTRSEYKPEYRAL